MASGADDVTGPDRVEELLLLWDEAREHNQKLTLEELCKDTPELLPELKRRAEWLARFDLEVTETFRDSADLPPPEIPGYELIRKVESGGMGTVYAARNVAMNDVRAVKVLRMGLAFGPQAEARFRREIRLQGQLKHSNVLPIYDAQVVDGFPYFLMPLIEGGSLSNHLDRFHADPIATARLMEQVARGVQAIHDRGILHRDLKPSNILLDQGDVPKVSDFGIATALEDATQVQFEEPHSEEDTPCEDRRALRASHFASAAHAGWEVTRCTYTGQMMGTFAYMAPEQVRGERDKFGPHTDVWAMGVILYRILTDQLPFGGSPNVEVTRRILEEEPEPVLSLRPKLTLGLSAIIARCLSKEPSERYPSAEALANALERWRHSRRYWRRHRWAMATMGLVLLFCGLGLAMMDHWADQTDRQGPPRRTPEELRQLALEPVYQELKAGAPTVLIGPGSTAPPPVRVFGIGKPLHPENPDDPTFLGGGSEAHLFEVLPHVPVEEYTIECEMAYRKGVLSPSEPNVGMGLLGHSEESEFGPRHSFLGLHLAEVGQLTFDFEKWGGKKGPGAFCSANFILTVPEKPYHIRTDRDRDQLCALPPPPEGTSPPVRTFRIKVQANTIEVSDSGKKQPFAHFDAKQLDRSRNMLALRLNVIPANLLPTNGGLFLFAFDSIIAVRKLEIIPADD